MQEMLSEHSRRKECIETMLTLYESVRSASREAQEVIKRVLKLEKDKIHQERPRVTADIVLILEEVVPEEGLV